MIGKDIGISAPRDIWFLRSELQKAVSANQDAAGTAPAPLADCYAPPQVRLLLTLPNRPPEQIAPDSLHFFGPLLFDSQYILTLKEDLPMTWNILLVIDDSLLVLAILDEIFKYLFQVECFEESRPAMSVATPSESVLYCRMCV